MSRHIPLRVRASNAIVALVDFSASAMATAEGEISQKDALLAQVSERIATLEAEKRVETQRVDSLLESLEKARELIAELRAQIEAEKTVERNARLPPEHPRHAEVRLIALICDLLKKRDSMDGIDVRDLDGELNALRAALP